MQLRTPSTQTQVSIEHTLEQSLMNLKCQTGQLTRERRPKQSCKKCDNNKMKWQIRKRVKHFSVPRLIKDQRICVVEATNQSENSCTNLIHRKTKFSSILNLQNKNVWLLKSRILAGTNLNKYLIRQKISDSKNYFR